MGHLDRLVGALSLYLQLDRGIARTAHLLHRLAEREASACSSSTYGVMMSLAMTPAFAAWVSSIGETTLIRPVVHRDLDTQLPEFPRVSICMSRKVLGLIRTCIEPGRACHLSPNSHPSSPAVRRTFKHSRSAPALYVAEEGKLPIGIVAAAFALDPSRRRSVRRRRRGRRGGAEENQGGERHRDSSRLAAAPAVHAY